MREENTNPFKSIWTEFTFHFLPTFYLVCNSSHGSAFWLLFLLHSWVTGVCHRERAAIPSGNGLGIPWRKQEHWWDFEDGRVKDEVLNLRLWLLKWAAEHQRAGITAFPKSAAEPLSLLFLVIEKKSVCVSMCGWNFVYSGKRSVKITVFEINSFS